LTTAPFGELITAMVTPYDSCGEVDYGKAAELALHLSGNGSDGLVISGTTGESPALSRDEKIQLFKSVVAAVKGKVKILAGTGGNYTHQSIELTKLAGECGVDGIMLVVPYYNKPSQDALLHHFSTIAGAVELPVMLYNVPGRTGVNMTAETTLRLAEIDNIAAVKEASGSLDQVSQICAKAPPGFAVYSGDDSLTLPIMAVGGVGVVSVASHVAGREIKNMITAYAQGNVATARNIHLRLLPLYNAMFITSNPVPVKSAMNLLGHELGSVRGPLIALNEKEKDIITRVMTELGFLS